MSNESDGPAGSVVVAEAQLRELLAAVSGFLVGLDPWSWPFDSDERQALRRLRGAAARIECGLAGRDVGPGKR